MENKFYFENNNSYSSGQEEFRDQALKYGLSKFESDLYREEDDIALKSVRVKRFVMPNKDEKWKIFEDSKILFVLDGSKLTKKEKIFLRTVDGINFLLSIYKSGNLKTVSYLKKEMKNANYQKK